MLDMIQLVDDSTKENFKKMLKRQLVGNAYKYAIAIQKNPTDGTKLPRKGQTPLRILNDAEIDTLMKTIEDNEIWGDFFYTELTTGLRRGEICGLKWTDFDDKNNTLYINRTIHMQKGGKIYEGEPKTGKGKRKIILPQSTADILKKRENIRMDIP